MNTNKSIRSQATNKYIDKYFGVVALSLAWSVELLLANRRPTYPKSILVTKLSAMGDTVLLFPALKALRAAYPGARIVALGTEINRVVYENCPYIDELIVLDIRDLVLHPVATIRKLREYRFDVSFDFDQWLRLTPLLAWLAGVRYRIGFRTKGQWRHFLFHTIVDHKTSRHESDCFLDIVRATGHEAPTGCPEFPVSPDAERAAADILEKTGVGSRDGFVVFHPSTPPHGEQRQWPPEYYVRLGRMVAEETRLRILLTGTAGELQTNEKICAGIGSQAVVLPPVTIPVLAAVLRRARAVVCGNTGVMHLGCAAGARVLAIHGPTDPVKWGPASPTAKVLSSDMPCSPCLYLGFEYGCSENRCLRGILPEKVFPVLKEMVAIIDDN